MWLPSMTGLCRAFVSETAASAFISAGRDERSCRARFRSLRNARPRYGGPLTTSVRDQLTTGPPRIVPTTASRRRPGAPRNEAPLGGLVAAPWAGSPEARASGVVDSGSGRALRRAGIICQRRRVHVAPPSSARAERRLIIVSPVHVGDPFSRAPWQTTLTGDLTLNYYELSPPRRTKISLFDSGSVPFSIMTKCPEVRMPGSLPSRSTPRSRLPTSTGGRLASFEVSRERLPVPGHRPTRRRDSNRWRIPSATCSTGCRFCSQRVGRISGSSGSRSNIASTRPTRFSFPRLYRDPSGKPATVSTSFLWQALKSTSGITLEGPGLEQGDGENGATVPKGRGIIDGLYTYTETERREAAEQIYNATKNGVDDAFEEKAGPPWSHIVSSPAEAIARQFTNCFAFDKCGRDGVFVDPDDSHPLFNFQFREPGEASRQPDDFRFWTAR